MFNLMQMMGIPQGKSNPQQMVSQMAVDHIRNNPLYQRAEQMAKGKSEDELEQVARNLCKQIGVDMGQAMDQFKSIFGIR